jgi:hypothetical protein
MLLRRGTWTTKERQKLKDLYNTIPLDELSIKMARSQGAITSQVNYLRKRGWTFNRRKNG